MGDLISREAAMDIIRERGNASGVPLKAVFCNAAHLLELLPAVEAEPVRHGTWELVPVGVNGHVTAYHGCSACGCVFKSPLNYCPNCGAKMDGEDT